MYLFIYTHSQWPSDTHLEIFLVHSWLLFHSLFLLNEMCVCMFLSLHLFHTHTRALAYKHYLHLLCAFSLFLFLSLILILSICWLIMQLFHFIYLLFFIININELVRYKIGGFFINQTIRSLIKPLPSEHSVCYFLFVSFFFHSI